MSELAPETHTGELLEPIAETLEGIRMVLGVVIIAVVLLLGGAKLERFLMKRQLGVIDGEGVGRGDRS